jgi:GNAT superfamily N-acetyltransferase
MSTAPMTPARIHVAPPANAAEWEHARRLTGEHIAWLAETVGLVGGEPSGTAGVHLMDPETAELRRVWITPAARGNRLAPVMLQSAIDTARSLGARRMWLETASGHMDKAISIYRRAGFEPIPHYTSLPEALPGVVSLGLALR